MTSHVGRLATHACSVEWDDAGQPAWGTASQARFWVCLEQPGPWGHAAITASHLDHEVGRELERACAEHGGRLLLIRRPGSHADEPHDGPRTVLVAGGLDRDPWLLQGELDDPARLLALSWESLLADDPDAATERLPELEETRDPALLICTNGKRDVCCAVRGRPLALETAARHPGAVWECSHTGGHRFAPTGIALPSGQTYARLTPDLAGLALRAEARHEVPAELADPAHNRGRSCFGSAAQVAETLVRGAIAELRGPALTASVLDGGGGSWQCAVAHVDGRRWTVQVTGVDGAVLKSSCAKAAVPSTIWSAELVG